MHALSIVICPCVLAAVLSVLLRYTVSDFPLCIIKLFFLLFSIFIKSHLKYSEEKQCLRPEVIIGDLVMNDSFIT